MVGRCGRLVIAASGLAGLAALVGCGGSAQARLRVPPEKRVRLVDDAQPRAMEFPRDAAFAVHDARSEQNPGRDGEARGEADATPDGSAWCAARGENGGQARGEFQIGQSVTWPRESPGQADVRFEFHFASRSVIEPLDDPAVDTQVRLTVSITDGEGRRLHERAVMDSAAQGGPAEGEGTDREVFRVRMTPGGTYYLLVAGEVEARSSAGGSAEARLEVSGLRIRVEPAGADIATPDR